MAWNHTNILPDRGVNQHLCMHCWTTFCDVLRHLRTCSCWDNMSISSECEWGWAHGWGLCIWCRGGFIQEWGLLPITLLESRNSWNRNCNRYVNLGDVCESVWEPLAIRATPVILTAVYNLSTDFQLYCSSLEGQLYIGGYHLLKKANRSINHLQRYFAWY